MDLVWIIYLIQLSDKISSASLSGAWPLLVIGSFLLLLGYVILNIVEGADEKEAAVVARLKGLVKATSKVFLPTMIVYISVKSAAITLAPSKETAYTMLAAYGVQEVYQNEDVKRLAGKSLEVLESYMDKHLEKVSEEGGEK